ncbi:serine-rich adhesin for platelets-like [Belonocnema kinseyi]|uniref:serine-rich adhesin for platelets-like n=1 Tax=Belonocnema kinseyi TaxID=2817044 RepID=UPI00143CCE9A|nr:serine-rich adhesin for platelets-like [Belonocnema kinseyi]XP_033209592.1 serine-rich adhesin for platelets-like [Belonocnema kinseyi]
MQKNRKILPKSTQTRLASNEATTRNKKPLLLHSKKTEKPNKNALSYNKFNPSKSVPSKGVQSAQRKMPSLQKPAKEYKVADFAEKSESVSTPSTTNTEREIAEAVFLLRKEISEWRAQESLRSRDDETERHIVSSERQVENEIYQGETNSRQEEFETLCVQSDKNGAKGSAIISTYPHQCDSGRSKKTEESANEFKTLKLPLQTKIQEAAVERENFSRSTLPIPNIPFSIINNPTMTKNICQETALAEKISSPPNSPILSPETTKILENAEKLVENAQKQIIEINQNILLHKANPEIPESQPTIDEDLLHLRQIVTYRFQRANNPSKVYNTSDRNTFMNSVQEVPENEITKAPRLLKLVTMLPERSHLETKDEGSSCKTMSYYDKRKLLLTDSIPNRFHASNKIQNESTNKNEKAAQTDENENKPESSTFQIQTGPRVIIKRSLQIQNVESLHISPESSVNEPRNVGIYNFQHETCPEKNAISQDYIIDKDYRQENKFLQENTAEKKQMYRKSVVIKATDESKLNFRKNSEKMVEKLSETNNSSRDDEIIVQSHREITAVDSTKSPKQCNIENLKAKAFSEFLSSLEKDLDYSITSNKAEDFEEVETNLEGLETDEKHLLEKSKKVNENSIQAPSNDEIKNAGRKSGKLRDKATIISNERVNLKYKDILGDNALNPKVSNAFFQLDKKSEDSEIEVDDINLKQPSVVDLDTVLKRNDEIINNVVHSTGTLFKIISSKLETYRNMVNQGNKKSEQRVELASVEKSTPTEKEHYFKFYEAPDMILDQIINGANKFSKFIPVSSEINDSVVNQESISNSQSVNLSSGSLSLISSTKNLISQRPSLEIKESPAPSNNQSAKELKNIKNSFEERKPEFSVSSSIKRLKNTSDEKVKDNDRIYEEGESTKSLSMQSSRVDDFKIREVREISKSSTDQSSNTEEIESTCKDFVLKPLSNSDLFSNIHNINYSRPFLQIKENDFSEMEIFSHIFESLRHSSAAMKRFITCLFGETEARIENEIIGILRETAVHPTIINKFLLILQRRDKNSQLPMFITNIGLYLNLSDDSIVKIRFRKQFKDFLEGRSKIFSFDAETDRNVSDDNTSNMNEKNDEKSTQIRLEFDVTKEDIKDIGVDITLAVTQEKIDLSPEENQEHPVEKGGFSFGNQNKIEKVLDEKNENLSKSERTSSISSDIKLIESGLSVSELSKSTSQNSLQKSHEKNENLNEMETKSSSNSDIKLITNVPSVGESSNKIDYSQNFTDISSTSKNSLQKSQENNENLNKMEVKSSSSSDIKSIKGAPSVSESSKRIDYSQNFTDISSTSKNSLQKSHEINENSNKMEIKSSSSLDIKLIKSGPSVSESSNKIDYSQNFTHISSTSKNSHQKSQENNENLNKMETKSSSSSDIKLIKSVTSVSESSKKIDCSQNCTDISSTSKNSLQKLHENNENSKKIEIKSSSTSEIKLIESGPSVSDSSKRIDYSQNFPDSSSTSKDCKSLESHISLKLSDSFMNKSEDNKETIPKRSDELEIQRKIDDLLNRDKRVADTIEKSLKTEIDNLTIKRSSEENVRRNPLFRGKTFVIKKKCNLGLNTKLPEESFSDVNSSMSDSQKGSNSRIRSEASESSGKNAESSSGTYSEGELHLPSSCSYSLGEIKLSREEKLCLRKAFKDINSSKKVYSSKKQNSDSSSSHLSNCSGCPQSYSLTRSLGEVYDSLS